MEEQAVLVLTVVYGRDGQGLHVVGSDLKSVATLRATRNVLRSLSSWIDEKLLEAVEREVKASMVSSG